jgi:hypothetical protein
MLWGTSSLALYIPWAGKAGPYLGTSLWLWLGVLDAIQGVGLGMILLQVRNTSIHAIRLINMVYHRHCRGFTSVQPWRLLRSLDQCVLWLHEPPRPIVSGLVVYSQMQPSGTFLVNIYSSGYVFISEVFLQVASKAVRWLRHHSGSPC